MLTHQGYIVVRVLKSPDTLIVFLVANRQPGMGGNEARNGLERILYKPSTQSERQQCRGTVGVSPGKPQRQGLEGGSTAFPY